MTSERTEAQGTHTRTRRIDHIVMPVATLAASRTLFDSLGFTVAPAASHPFGTENACVFFADGAYLEPLAVGDPAAYAAAGQSGAVFVSRDAAFRYRRGAPGFSGIAFKTDDAEADWRGFRDAGLADGDLFQFARTFEAPDGTRRELGFRLAFAADRRSPDVFFFACQALAKPGDRSALTRHANGASGIARLVLSEPSPEDFASLLRDVTGEPPVTTADGGLRTADGRIAVLTPVALGSKYGANRAPGRGLRFEGVVVAVPELAAVATRATQATLPFRRHGEGLVVPLTAADGPFLAFQPAD